MLTLIFFSSNCLVFPDIITARMEIKFSILHNCRLIPRYVCELAYCIGANSFPWEKVRCKSLVAQMTFCPTHPYLTLTAKRSSCLGEPQRTSTINLSEERKCIFALSLRKQK